MAEISKITLPNGDTYDIKDAVARGNVDHGNARIFSADCSTAASTQRKDVTIAECTELIAGDVFVITFTNAQLYNGAPTMQINGLGAKNIRTQTGVNAGRYEWNVGEVVVFKWTGTYFVITTGARADTAYYGRTKLYTGSGSTSQALALTPRSLYDMANLSICPYYSTSETYAVGDKVRYSNYIYECITEITTAEAWTAAHWQIAPTLQEQVTSLNSNKMNSAIESTLGEADILARNPGAYRYNRSCSNIPSDEPGYLEIVERDSTTKVATAISNSGLIFLNVMNSGTWIGWKELAQASDLTALQEQVTSLNSNKMNSTMSSTMRNVDVLALNPGAYRYHSNCTNKPTTDSGFIQLFYRDDTTKLAIANTSSGRMFTNVMINGSWTGWRELAQNSNSEFHPALNSATVSTAILDGIRYGNVCKITFNINVKVSGSGWVTVATIPAGYTPAIRQYGVCAVDSTVSAGEGKIAEVRVTTDNELQIYVPMAKAYWGGIEYICS